MSKLETGLHYSLKLDALPPNWKVGYVGDFADAIQPGFASGKHNKEGAGIPHIRPFNIDRQGKLDLSEIKSVAPDCDAKRLHTGDVLFNNTNSPELIGKTAVIASAGEWGFSNHMTRIRFKDDVVPKFAAYQLHFLWMTGYYLHNCVKHVNQASISSKMLANAVPFIAPPLGQQKRIVAEIEKQFSRLDEAVANLKRVKANLRRYKAAVLKAAVEGRLVETEAERARREGRSYETGAQLLQRILETRRSQWQGKGKYKEPAAPDTTDLLELPEGWVWATIEQLTWLVTSGSRGWGDYYSDDGVLFIRAQDIKTDSLNIHGVARVTIPTATEGTRSSVSSRDILITITGANVTKSALVQNLGEIAFVSQHVALLKLNQPEMAPFIFNWIVSPSNGRKFLESWAYGAGKPGLSLEQVRSLPVAVPPFHEQHRIVADIDRRLSVLRETEAQVDANLRRAARLRRSILGEAFNARHGERARLVHA